MPSRPKAKRPTLVSRYLRETEGPWPSLLLVLPLVVAYEASTRGLLWKASAGAADQLVAFSMLRRGFDLLGATGTMLPAMTLVACLLGWHIAKRDSWKIRPTYLGVMAIEGSILALPIAGLGFGFVRYRPCAAVDQPDLPQFATFAIGAAVYEELLFRLLGFALLHTLIVDVAGISRKIGNIVTLISSACLFAAYHYLGHERFEWASFVFRSAAGLFLGVVFVSRGFGITAVCHVVYDLWCLSALRQNSPM